MGNIKHYTYADIQREFYEMDEFRKSGHAPISVEEWAEQIGVPCDYLAGVIDGSRRINLAMMKYLGYQPAYLYIKADDAIDEIAAAHYESL